MKLFPFQEEGVREILEQFETSNKVCLAWYTGAGKTNTFVEVCRRILEKNPNARIGISCYLTTEIRDQIHDRLERFGLADKAYLFTAQRDKRRKMYETGDELNRFMCLFLRLLFYRHELKDVKFDYMIVDESHAGLAQDTLMIQTIRRKTCTPKTKYLLVSATPWDSLAHEDFKDAPILKRPLDQGLKDGLVTDFVFHAEEALITFTEEDFTDQGDLGTSAAQRKHALLKSACFGKFEYILDTYDKELGKKCVVVCPPGNMGEIARHLAEKYKKVGLPFIEYSRGASKHIGEHYPDTRENLRTFKEDPNIRFLFVVNKCSVGFDMLELQSIIDMTMTRNIKVLAQRTGRVARKNGNQPKHYFYVYDQSLMKERLEWLVTTMVDFTLGAYEGWTTRMAMRKATKVSGWGFTHPYSTTLTDVITALRRGRLIQNARTLRYLNYDHVEKTSWSLPKALEEASKFSTRTEMWDKKPALYKWFRLNAKNEMDQLFPLKVVFGKWNERTVLETLKENEGAPRKWFRTNFAGVMYWLQTRDRLDLMDKYLAPSKSSKKWNEESVKRLLARLRSWGHLRAYQGARKWCGLNKGTAYWKAYWEEIHKKKARSRGKPGRVA